jgi:hypothetical protein
MDIRKYEKLINLVINEDQEAADALFHEIVVEKSREIFESIMADEDMMDEGMGGQVGDMLDEINAEESGLSEDEDEEDIDFDQEMDFDDDMSGGEEHIDDEMHDEHEEIEDAVIRIEDKLDQLMAEFENIMAGEEGEEDFGGEEDEEGEEDFGGEEDEAVMENINLHKVSVTHGDNGHNTKSTVAFNSGQVGMDSKPVKFSGDAETVPTAPKKPSNPYSKGEGNLPGAGNFKNVPGKDNFKEKGDTAPKPKHGDDGSNSRSPVAESRRPTRRPIR